VSVAAFSAGAVMDTRYHPGIWRSVKYTCCDAINKHAVGCTHTTRGVDDDLQPPQVDTRHSFGPPPPDMRKSFGPPDMTQSSRPPPRPFKPPKKRNQSINQSNVAFVKFHLKFSEAPSLSKLAQRAKS